MRNGSCNSMTAECCTGGTIFHDRVVFGTEWLQLTFGLALENSTLLFVLLMAMMLSNSFATNCCKTTLVNSTFKKQDNQQKHHLRFHDRSFF